MVGAAPAGEGHTRSKAEPCEEAQERGSGREHPGQARGASWGGGEGRQAAVVHTRDRASGAAHGRRETSRSSKVKPEGLLQEAPGVRLKTHSPFSRCHESPCAGLGTGAGGGPHMDMVRPVMMENLNPFFGSQYETKSLGARAGPTTEPRTLKTKLKTNEEEIRNKQK